MPIYEYECDACGHEFEREQRITDKPVKTCPSCRARRARRLISRTSFVLKGSGWYSDLYSSAKPDGKQAEGSTGDAKPDAKPSEKPAASDSDSGSKSDSKRKGSKKKGPKAAA